MSVSIRAAQKSFAGQAVIDGIDLEIASGEFFTVLGPSGCGKSTLLRLIAGLEVLDGGSIALAGRQVSGPGLHLPPEERGIGFVFQSYALWPHMSVLDNVAFAAEARGQGRRQARALAQVQLEVVDLAPLAGRRPAELSGGQRQRVALARCLAGGARLILMDEPLANLDPHLRNRMEEELARFHARAGVSILYITHDQREAMALADRVAVMRAGRFLQIADPATLHDRPSSAEVARFIGRAAVCPAQIQQGQARIGALSVPLIAPAPDGPAQVVLRPGDLYLGDPDSSSTNSANKAGPARVPARIVSGFYRGDHWEGLAELEGLAEPLPLRSDTPLRVGARLGIGARRGWALPR